MEENRLVFCAANMFSAAFFMFIILIYFNHRGSKGILLFFQKTPTLQSRGVDTNWGNKRNTKATLDYWHHLAKSYILKSPQKFTCFTSKTVSGVSKMSLIFTKFTYFPRDVSETHIYLVTLRRTPVNFVLWLVFTPNMHAPFQTFYNEQHRIVNKEQWATWGNLVVSIRRDVSIVYLLFPNIMMCAINTINAQNITKTLK